MIQVEEWKSSQKVQVHEISMKYIEKPFLNSDGQQKVAQTSNWFITQLSYQELIEVTQIIKKYQFIRHKKYARKAYCKEAL